MLFLMFCCFITPIFGEFVFPEPEIVVYKPKGFKVSIPDDGYTLFAVHININKEMEGLEAGQIARDIISKRNNRWTYNDKETKLKEGDKLFFWLYVIKDKLGYRLDDQTYEVQQLEQRQGASTTRPNKVTTTKRPNCEKSKTTVSGHSVCKGEVIFHHHFVTTAKWDTEDGWAHEVLFSNNNEDTNTIFNRQFENAKVHSGTLTIKPNLLERYYNVSFITEGCLQLKYCTSTEQKYCEKCAKFWEILPPVVSARITTKKFFTFQYGKVEVNAKLPKGDWIVPEIWLQSKESFYGSESGKMVLAQVYGNKNLNCDGKEIGYSLLRMGLVVNHTNDFNEKLREDAEGWTNRYHKFAVNWTPYEMSFSIDDQPVGRDLENGKLSPFNKEFFISLGVHVAGRVDFPDNCNSNGNPKPWKNEGTKQMLDVWRSRNQWFKTWSEFDGGLEVDYVKVTAL